MNENKKEGVSVKELEEFAKKHRLEVFFGLLFILAFVFGIIGHFGTWLSVLFTGGAAILSIVFPAKIDMFIKKSFQFLFKQDTTIQIVLGIVSLILAIFIPFVIFFCIGLIGGRAMHQMAMDSSPK